MRVDGKRLREESSGLLDQQNGFHYAREWERTERMNTTGISRRAAGFALVAVMLSSMATVPLLSARAAEQQGEQGFQSAVLSQAYEAEEAASDDAGTAEGAVEAVDEAGALGATVADDAAADAGAVTDDAAADDAAADAVESDDAGAASVTDAAGAAGDAGAASVTDAAGAAGEAGSVESTGLDGVAVQASSTADTVAASLLTAPAAAEQTVQGVVYVRPQSGDDANTGATAETAFKTLTAAVNAAKADASVTTIDIAGDFGAESAAIPSGKQLLVSGDATFTGNGSGGITLESGSSISTSSGATLTMSGFSTAITLNSGSTMGDGTYVLDANQVALSVESGSSVEGTSRDALVISAQNCTGNVLAFGRDGGTFAHCTVNASCDTDRQVYCYPLLLDDVSFTWSSVHLRAYGCEIANSNLTVRADKTSVQGDKWYQSNSNALGLESAGTITESTVEVSGARFTIVSPMTVSNSTIYVHDSAAGGINVNWGAQTTFDNAVIRTSNITGYASYGTGNSGDNLFKVSGSTTVETDAVSSQYDNGGAASGSMVVLGGSFKIAYDGSNYSVTTPTNGADHGDERLHLFTLSDSSVTSLTVVDANGVAYDYPVANANSDGLKRVWVPAATVTFELNDPQAAGKVDATFSDGTVGTKSALAMRGQTLAAASSVVGDTTAAPQDDPVALGYTFAGWFYRDANGVEQPFDAASTVVSSDITVYAK
jgi:hypothetical protein